MPRKKLIQMGVFLGLLGLLFAFRLQQAPAYRDLNKNGKMDVYEDGSQPIDKRVDDLLKKMTLEEKVGTMFINGARVNDDGSIENKPGSGMFAFAPNALDLMREKKMTHFNLWQVPGVTALAKWYNAMQKYAEEHTRLGIPITIASDPRNSFSASIFSMAAQTFSLWPEQPGFAAIGDTMLMRQAADIMRQEYLAVGIREALHPMADLATEPRWPRISGTFGEDAQLASRMVKAYIEGYQGPELTSTSVACMTKHFAGGGPQKEGLDPHFDFQKGQVYPGNNFNYHLVPFEAAFEAHTAAIMPYYGVPTDQTSENVGFGYNKDIITKLLRDKYHFDGVVCTDWGLVSDAHIGPVTWPARAWGVEGLSREQRVEKIVNAGCDQFGGEDCTDLLVNLVMEGRISMSRIDQSVRRLLRQKFELGLFDNPFVDENAAAGIVGQEAFRKAADMAQRRSITLLKNDRVKSLRKKALPLPEGKLKLYVEGIDKNVASSYGTIVSTPEEADIAIIRLQTPWVPVKTDNFLARMFHHGDLDFKQPKLDSILTVLKKVPTVVDIYLDRPAVIPEISKGAAALVANYGASDAALLDVLFGKYKPEGHLPFELPSSMEAVRNQKEDLPYDSKDPLYKFGFGLSYQ